jgi:hypothetical protein
MVNRRLPRKRLAVLVTVDAKTDLKPRKAERTRRGYVQILDKSDFVELLENFGLILLDYAQKHLRTANGNFKPACYV